MKQKSLLKTTAILCAYAAGITTMSATAPTGLAAGAEDSPAFSTATEAAVLAELLETFGYESVTELLGETRTLPDVSRIKDLDGNNVVNVLDAQYLLMFLDGAKMYSYEYSELDVTGDYILSRIDAEVYLQYAAYYLIHQQTAPFSSHGSLRTINTTFEYRSYRKHLYSNGYSTTYDTTYTLNSSTNAPDDAETTNSHSASASSTYDTRIVMNSGSGFINSPHTFVTAAHCVYNLSSGLYSSAAIKVSTYENGIPNQTTLTPVSVHIPVDYLNSTLSNRHFYDYAVVEVEEDLSAYGSFEAGILLDGVDTLVETNTTGIPTVLGGFPSLAAYDYNNDRGYPAAFAGELNDFSDYDFTTTSARAGSMSGGVHYTTVTYNGVSRDVAFGVHNSGVGNDIVTYSRGSVITRPILQFLYNNPYLP